MPLALVEHRHRIVDAYLWGLLPDNELIIERWAKRFQVSARSAFALMAHVGEDCAGAIRFVTPDKVALVTRRGTDTVQWLAEKDVAERLRDLRRDASAWRRETDSGQFSLGGAQPKTALLFDGPPNKVYVSSEVHHGGRAPLGTAYLRLAGPTPLRCYSVART